MEWDWGGMGQVGLVYGAGWGLWVWLWGSLGELWGDLRAVGWIVGLWGRLGAVR